MGIVLPKELEAFVARLVASGAYDNAEAVLADALRVLQRSHEAGADSDGKLEWLKAAIAESEKSGAPVALDLDEFQAVVSGRAPIPEPGSAA
ncbi:MAG: type II toxin-antitoxin system ParD family antitoxin [Alphaproteobacteria bacterium]|nr:type II toxin-antitoxin system ParD family antitoxin [Alphaproteobacteria bacterium]